MMASMASASKHHQIIEDVFVTKEVNKAGIYLVRLFIRGKPWLVPVDDNFLFNRGEDKNLRFAKFIESSNSLWAPILEKALAKVKGTYKQLEGGSPSNGMRFLTGAPSYWHPLHPTDEHRQNEMWRIIKQSDNNGFIMTVGTGGGMADKNECGVTNNHALSLLSAFYLQDPPANN